MVEFNFGSGWQKDIQFLDQPGNNQGPGTTSNPFLCNLLLPSNPTIQFLLLISKRLKSERGPAKYRNSWLLGFGLCFENKLQKETFGCFPLLGILKAAARRYSCLSLTLGKRSCLMSDWTTIFFKKFQLPLLIFPKPENKLYTKERFWDRKLNSCVVISERSQQRAI